MSASGRWRAALLLAAVALPAASWAMITMSDREQTEPVFVMRLEGGVSPVMDEALGQAIARTERTSAVALVLEIDTPGGLETSMRAMVKRLLASRKPVIAWVEPSGAHAASAGVFIVMASDVAAMAPGTNIGAATPINMSGPMDSTLARKATNDASAFARTVAEQRGRNVAWAEDAVRHAVAVNEREAVELKVVDFVASDLEDLLAKSDGRTWRRGASIDTLHVRGHDIIRIEPGFRQKLLGLIADPNIAYLLMMLGFYGLLFELQNPGAILPGVAGAICLILAFLALSALSVNVAGIALIVVGMAFLLIEIKVTSHGVLAVGGTIALLLGSLILFHADTMQVSLTLVIGVTLATVAFFLVVIGAGLRAQRRPGVTGAAGLVGLAGVALSRLAPEGRVRIGDELWNAVADTEIDAGAAVRVTAVNGLTLRVRPAGKEA